MPLAFADLVRASRQVAASRLDEIVDLAARVAAVPAPTGDERERAALVAALLSRSDGCRDVRVDPLGNVTAVVPGRDARRAVLFAAHIDTVFPLETPLAVRRTPGLLHGPGIGDNAVAVAALVALPSMLRAMRRVPAVDVVLAATVGEEGLGNLRGMRAVMDANRPMSAAIALEGHNLGRVTHFAVGSRRLRIRVEGRGGHSWGDAGEASAIHVAGRIIADLDALAVPRHPKTTLNVGTMSGGTSVNTIAPDATLLVDLRSIDAGALDDLTGRVERVVRQARSAGIETSVEVIGERPAATLPGSSALVLDVNRILRELGIAPIPDASSTDANIPLSRGIPAVCLGLTRGGNVHTVEEYVEIEPLTAGIAQVLMASCVLTDAVAAGRVRPRACPPSAPDGVNVPIASD